MKNLIKRFYHDKIAGVIPPPPNQALAKNKLTKEAKTYNLPIGTPVLYGKYKNKKGIITGFGTDDKGQPTVKITPDPKGQKREKEMTLFKIRKKVTARYLEAATTPLPDHFDKSEIGLMSRTEFLEFRNPENKIHWESPYDRSLKDLNRDFSIEVRRGSLFLRGKPGFEIYGNDKGFLIYTSEFGVPGKRLVAILHKGTYYYSNYVTESELPKGYTSTKQDRDWVPFDISNYKKVKYIYEKIPLISDTKLLNLKTYPQIIQRIKVKGDYYEVRSAKSLQTDKGITIVIMNDQGEVVAQASDEWGATLLVVAKEYRGKGLGRIIGGLWYKWNPSWKSGGFTPEGEINATKIWEKRVREFLSYGWYSELIRQGRMTLPRFREITRDLPGRKPQVPEAPKATESTKKELLFYIDDPVFAIYDRRFLENPDEKYIYAHGFFRSAQWVGVFLYSIEYDRPFHKMATYTAFQMARDLGDKIYIGKGYGDVVELSGLDHIEVTEEGQAFSGEPKIYAELTRDMLPLRSLAQKEKMIRRKVDRYGEIETLLLELAEAKWS